MIKKISLIIFLSTILNIYFLNSSFAEQIAVTEDGREVMLHTNRKWEYVSDQDIIEIDTIRINNELKDALRYRIEERDNVFAEMFYVHIDWELPYDVKYISVIKGLRRARERWQPREGFHDELIGPFGERVAGHLMWVFEHWELWVETCGY